MNPANHGQCHIRRNSREERVEGELERMAEAMNQPPPPQIKVTSAESNGRTRYGSISSVATHASVATHTPYLDESSTTTTNTATFNSDITPNRMRRRLKFFFMDPIEKWHARRRFPWKLILQIIKIIVVTAQLCLFAQQRFNHVNYLWDTKISFSHFFIKGWDTSREIQVYPPSSGPLAVYKKSEFFENLDYAITSFINVEDEAIGTLLFERQEGQILDPKVCITQYVDGEVFSNGSYVLNDNSTTYCLDIYVSEVNTTDFSVERYLQDKYNVTFDFDLLLNTAFIFELRTIKLRVNLPFETPECYKLTNKLIFNNHDRDGQMLINFDIGARVLDCDGSVKLASEAKTLKVWRTVINVSSIMVCLVSFIMCIRAIYRAQILKKTTVMFFKRHYDKDLNFEERMEFVNLWYVLICINDILIIIGSFLKIGLESKFFGEQNFTPGSSSQLITEEEERSYDGYLDTWNVCSLFLGLGNLFVWFGCLRYLGFFTTYNVLILTIKKCIPNVLRFSICILMMFFGYSLCGWLVLGPYHLKFRTFSSTMECLYSLINGDDMFATFSSTSGKDPLVWWFSRIYLYTFISLFIYVILSLFIAIIMDAYETIKNYYIEGFPLNEVKRFVCECQEEPSSRVFQDDGDRTIHDVINSLCCCGQNTVSRQDGEYEALIT